jgi:hypothetical protein
MQSVVMWIRDGAFASRPKKDSGSEFQDKTLFDQFGMVRILTDTHGTQVQWSMSCPNWGSLMLAAKLVTACAGPFTLKYFNAGWFIESLTTGEAAEQRIESLIFKSDVRLSNRAYTSVVIPDMKVVPGVLRRALESGTAPDDCSIVCTVEPDRQISQVEHVGKNSLIAQIWGVSPNSYPCLNGHSYDRVVTPEYFRVVKSGKPHYDHVMASMVRPDGELHWYSYQRVILPDVAAGRARVRVISEIAPVKIQLL